MDSYIRLRSHHQHAVAALPPNKVSVDSFDDFVAKQLSQLVVRINRKVAAGRGLSAGERKVLDFAGQPPISIKRGCTPVRP